MRKQASTNFHNEQEILRECPFSRTLEVLGNRWRAVVLWKVLQGVARFGELGRAIPPISEKMLAQELRELERRGLVSRLVQGQNPLHVSYAPTPRGCSLEPLLQQMFDWGEQNA